MTSPSVRIMGAVQEMNGARDKKSRPGRGPRRLSWDDACRDDDRKADSYGMDVTSLDVVSVQNVPRTIGSPQLGNDSNSELSC